MLSDLHTKVKDTLTSAGVIPDSIPGFASHFDLESSYAHPFNGLETQYLQLKYYKERFSYIVSVYMCTNWCAQICLHCYYNFCPSRSHNQFFLVQQNSGKGVDYVECLQMLEII